jgi:hypothetical protein
MPTGTLGVAARQDPRQLSNTLKKTTNFNDAGIAAGVSYENYLPQSAFIITVMTEIVTAFNAGSTNVYTVGTVGAAFNNFVAAGDVNPALAGIYPSTRAIGRSLTAAAAVLPVAKYTQTGTPATTGQAITLIEFEGGWAS